MFFAAAAPLIYAAVTLRDGATRYAAIFAIRCHFAAAACRYAIAAIDVSLLLMLILPLPLLLRHHFAAMPYYAIFDSV